MRFKEVSVDVFCLSEKNLSDQHLEKQSTQCQCKQVGEEKLLSKSERYRFRKVPEKVGSEFIIMPSLHPSFWRDQGKGIIFKNFQIAPKSFTFCRLMFRVILQTETWPLHRNVWKLIHSNSIAQDKDDAHASNVALVT